MKKKFLALGVSVAAAVGTVGLMAPAAFAGTAQVTGNGFVQAGRSHGSVFGVVTGSQVNNDNKDTVSVQGAHAQTPLTTCGGQLQLTSNNSVVVHGFNGPNCP